MKDATKTKVLLVMLAIGLFLTLPVNWGIARAIVGDLTGPQPFSWPFLLIPFVGIFIALYNWPPATKTSSKGKATKQ